MKRINSNFCVFLIALTHASVFIPMGMNMSAMNPATPAIEVFVNETYKTRYNVTAPAETIKLVITMAQTMLVIGAALGSLSLRLWITYLSRRTVLLVMHVVALTSSILMGPVAYFSKSYELIIIGRLLNGMARGVGFSVAPIYVGEVTSRKTLAFYQTPHGWLVQISAAIGNAVAHPNVLGGVDRWQYGLAMPGVFSLIYLVCGPWIPETLTWVIQKEREKSKQTISLNPKDRLSYWLLRKLRYHRDEALLGEYRSIETEIDADSRIQRAAITDLFSTGKYRRQLFAVIVIQTSVQICGAQAIFQYTNTILEEAGIRQEDSTNYTVGMTSLLAVSSILASALRQRVGSRKMLISGLCVVSIAMAILIAASVSSRTIPAMAYVSVASVAVLLVGIGIGPMLCLSAYPSEVTTQVTRPNAMWMGGVSFWITGSVQMLVIPYSLSAWGGYAYFPFLLSVLFVIAYVSLFIPDTHNRSVTSIQRHFEKGKASSCIKGQQKQPSNSPQKYSVEHTSSNNIGM